MRGAGRVTRRIAAGGLLLGSALAATSALGGPDAAVRPAADARPEARAVVDRVAVRFFAPETGGPARPRFITERVLAFESRLEAMIEDGAPHGQAPAERHVRSALDRHVAEELLSTLAEKSSAGDAETSRLAREARADLEQRVGGDGPLFLAAEEEGLDADEVQAIFVRRARAASYVDRSMTRFLHPSEEQLREVFRAGQHPFRDHPYEDVRPALSRWFVFERLKALEQSFLQTARSRVTVVTVPR